MRFLADESCDHAVVRALRAAGFDVLAVADVTPRATDEAVIELAARDGRVLLTEDKDFGQLVYALGHSTVGVILIRYPGDARQSLPPDVLRLVAEHGRDRASREGSP